jgi:hypothetical protein
MGEMGDVKFLSLKDESYDDKERIRSKLIEESNPSNLIRVKHERR